MAYTSQNGNFDGKKGINKGLSAIICSNPQGLTPGWYFYIPTETILSDLGFWLNPQNHEVLGFRLFDWWSDDHADDVGFAIYILKNMFHFHCFAVVADVVNVVDGQFFNTVPTHDETHITWYSDKINWNSSSARLRPSASAKRLRTDAIVMVVTRFPLFLSHFGKWLSGTGGCNLVVTLFGTCVNVPGTWNLWVSTLFDFSLCLIVEDVSLAHLGNENKRTYIKEQQQQQQHLWKCV